MDVRPIEPEWRWLGNARFWLVSAAAAAVLLLAVGLHAWHVSSRHATPQEAFLYGQRELVPGAPTAYRAFVRNAMTSEPVPEARVSFALLDPGGATVWKTGGTTDANGIIEILPALPDDAPEGDYTLKADVSSTAGESTISRGVAVQRSFRALVTTDKPLYQPGQTIHIRTLALAKADLRPVARRGIVLEVQDAKGNKVFKKVTKTSEFGIASAGFVLADQVNMGEYTVSATVGDTTSERSVRVKRYRLPKFKVSLSTYKGYYAPGDTVVCDLAADYTFGKPVAGGKVRVVASEYIEKLRSFAEVSGVTDADGRLRVEIPLKRSFVGQQLKKGDAFVTLEATVTDAADHTQKKTLDLTVTTSPIRIEVFPESGQLVQNVENVLYVVTAYPDGRPAKTRLYFRKIDEWAETSDVGVAKIKITPREPHLQLTIFAKGSHGVRAEATRDLRVDARADTVLLRTDRAVYKAGGTAVVSVLSPGMWGRVFLDVVKDRRTVLMKGVDLKGVRGELALDLSADLFGTLELHAYRIMRDGNIVGDAKVIQVTRADDLTITASLDKEVYRPAEKAILDLVVRRAGREGKGEPVRTALGLSGVDEAVFALQEMRPGLERVYFMLQEEILKPRYEICAHPPFSARRAVRQGPPERPELEEASVVLFSSAEASAPPARDASETFWEKNQRFRRDKRRYYAGL
ncbi:MAG: MG2 domain-containing protein, partial [Planctomycetota bacterium]